MCGERAALVLFASVNAAQSGDQLRGDAKLLTGGRANACFREEGTTLVRKTSRGNWKTSGFARALFRGAGAIHRGLYKTSGGKIGGSMQGVPVGLLTTRGRKSGRMYTWPVCYIVNGDDLLLVGSAGGSPRNPDWFYNLRANGEVILQIGKQRHSMVAEPQIGPAHDTYWTRILEQYPLFAKYQRQVTRQIPVVLLRSAS